MLSDPSGSPTLTLLDRWHLAPTYFPRAIALSFLIRLALALMRATERKQGEYFKAVAALFLGREHGPLVKDYWQPFILGMIEILTYPVLLRTDNLHIIGAWIGLKTIAQWKEWSLNRAHFNRFLIGNAMVIIASVLFLAPLVTVDSPTPKESPVPILNPAPTPTAH